MGHNHHARVNVHLTKLSSILVALITLDCPPHLALLQDNHETIHPFVVFDVVENTINGTLIENFKRYLSRRSEQHPLKAIFVSNYSDLIHKKGK